MRFFLLNAGSDAVEQILEEKTIGFSVVDNHQYFTLTES